MSQYIFLFESQSPKTYTRGTLDSPVYGWSLDRLKTLDIQVDKAAKRRRVSTQNLDFLCQKSWGKARYHSIGETASNYNANNKNTTHKKVQKHQNQDGRQISRSFSPSARLRRFHRNVSTKPTLALRLNDSGMIFATFLPIKRLHIWHLVS